VQIAGLAAKKRLLPKSWQYCLCLFRFSSQGDAVRKVKVCRAFPYDMWLKGG
jgi:hypothetical protein